MELGEDLLEYVSNLMLQNLCLQVFPLTGVTYQTCGFLSNTKSLETSVMGVADWGMNKMIV